MEFRMGDNHFYAAFEYGSIDISGDARRGFRPYQLMVSSIAVCSGGVLRKILSKMRLEFDDISIKADVDRNPEQADRIEKIHLHFIVKGKQLAANKVERALQLARKNCSMVQSVQDSIDITETFEIA